MQIKRRPPRWSPCALAGALLLRPAGVARADPEERPLPRFMRVEYHSPPGPLGKGCPGSEEFQDLVVPNAKRNPFNKDATALLWVSISRSRGRYEVTFELRDAAGVAVYTEPVEPRFSCDSLVRALAFQIGFRLKDRPAPEPLTTSATTTTPTPASTPETATTTATTTETSKITSTPTKEMTTTAKTPSTTPPATAPRLWALRGAASGGIGFGVSPADVAGVFNLEGGVQWRFNPNWMISVSLGMLWSPRRSALRPAEMSQVGVGTTLVTGVAAPCIHRRIAFVWAFGCTGLELGRLYGEVTRNDRSWDGGAWWVAFQPRLGAEVPLPSVPHFPRLAVRAFGNADVPLLPAQFRILEGPSMSTGRITPVWTTQPVAGAFHLGLLAWYDL
jgi:hypothetical protein